MGWLNFLLIAQRYIMGAAFYNGNGRNQSQFGIPVQIGNGGDTAVAHGGLDLIEGSFHIVVQGTGVGDIAVHAFLKGQLAATAQIIALPVAGAVEPSPQYSFM